ncbi:MAG: hypothetical protein ACPK85_16395 [Methanosarcina sp.]
MSKPFYENIKNTPANSLAILLLVITPKILTDYNIFRNELLTDEKIIWAGKPETKFILKGEDVVLSLFGLVITGFLSLFFRGDFITSAALFEISIFTIMFLAGLYYLFGRFIFDYYEKKRTFYAVTNQRVLIITNTYKKNVQAELISQIPALIKTVHKDDIGTIQFDNVKFDMSGESNEYIYPPAFKDIKNVDTIYKLINDLRKPCKA